MITHKGNQRRHNQSQTRQHHSRYLIANRFSCARRHHAEAITPRKHGFHQRFLARTKTVVTEMLLQRPAGNIHCALTRFSGHRTPSKNKNRNFLQHFFDWGLLSGTRPRQTPSKGRIILVFLPKSSFSKSPIEKNVASDAGFSAKSPSAQPKRARRLEQCAHVGNASHSYSLVTKVSEQAAG